MDARELGLKNKELKNKSLELKNELLKQKISEGIRAKVFGEPTELRSYTPPFNWPLIILQVAQAFGVLYLIISK